jgi:hypothetical protein
MFNGSSTAAWQLQTALLKPPEIREDSPKTLKGGSSQDLTEDKVVSREVVSDDILYDTQLFNAINRTKRELFIKS